MAKRPAKSRPFHFAILTRNPRLYSAKRLVRELKRAHAQVDLIDPLKCALVVDGPRSSVQLVGDEGMHSLGHFDAILPRIGASITDYGLALVKQFEALGMRVINPSDGIAQSRDKLRSLQILSTAGIEVPATILTRDKRSLEQSIPLIGGMPAVLKTLQGTQGVGVMLVHSALSLSSVIDTFRGMKQDVFLQQFLKQSAGRDYRAFVVGNRVIASMLRTAPEGEFRSNIHRGGSGTWVELPADYRRIAIRAAQAFRLGVAGVDLMEGPNGPIVIEVNSSPGFEGIEKATGLNVAREITRWMIQRAASRST